MAFIMFRYVLPITTLMRVLFMSGYWVLSNASSVPVEMVMWLKSFLSLMCYITLIDLQILNHPCISKINPTWSWCMVLLTCCWIWNACILLRIFVSVFISGESEVAQLCPTLSTQWTVAHHAPPPMGFSRQEYWSGLPYRPIIFFLCDILVFGIRVMVSS